MRASLKTALASGAPSIYYYYYYYYLSHNYGQPYQKILRKPPTGSRGVSCE